MGSVVEMENRYLIKTGLANVKNVFLRTLLQKQAYSITGSSNASWEEILSKTNAVSIAFYIVPFVNALIRVGTMEEKKLLFEAFIDGDQLVPCKKLGAKGTMATAADEAARVCTNAKAHQNKIKEDAVDKLEARIFKYDLLENKVLFIRLDETDKFPPELNGLVAMQLSNRYKKPTIIARMGEDGLDKGSARGLNESELKDFRQFLIDSKLFEYAQGHANAFGVSIPDRNYDKFIDYANEALKDIDFGENVYDINFERNASDADLSALIYDMCAVSGLWGQFNPEPMICVHKIHAMPEDIKIMGKGQDTVKIESNGISYLKFRAKDLIEELKEFNGPMEIDVIGRANINNWMGRTSPQMFIEDCEIREYKQPALIEF